MVATKQLNGVFVKISCVKSAMIIYENTYENMKMKGY